MRQVAHAQATDATTAVHFLEQATFGPTALDVTAVQGMGPAAWIHQQFGSPRARSPTASTATSCARRST